MRTHEGRCLQAKGPLHAVRGRGRLDEYDFFRSFNFFSVILQVQNVKKKKINPVAV